MSEKIKEDLAELQRKLRLYIDNGRLPNQAEVREEPAIASRPDMSKMKTLRKTDRFDGNIMAIDCSTRTLKRAGNWGVYVLRAAFAVVRGRDLDWEYEERICTVIGDAHARYRFLGDARVELESQTGLDAIRRRKINDGDFLLLDGPSHFGGSRKFRISLYETSKKTRINLLAISKQSPSLHDERGRDLIAAVSVLSSAPSWVYHPVTTANTDEHRYGDVSIVKLCATSPRAFRCDIMEYLTSEPVDQLLSPLTCISEDPRCLGYPATLWLAHDFSQPSDSKLLNYHDQVEELLSDTGMLETLRREELSSSFADELHGIKHAYEWEWWDDQF